MRFCILSLFACALACLCGRAADAAQTIDLKDYCNFSLTNSLIGKGPMNGPNNLATFPVGKGNFGSVPFLISGIVQLTGHQAVLASRSFPEKIEGIKVGAPCARIHLLHGAGWNDLEDTTVATLVIHYSDKTSQSIPIIYGKHVYDWWVNDEKPSDPGTEIAWTGVNRISKMFGTDLRIYRTTFGNPKPGAVIDHIDYVSAKKQSAPFLLGLTIE